MPKPATILVIEDDDMFRKMVRAMLVSAGYGVLEADSAKRASPCTVSSAPLYKLTSAGRKALKVETAEWERLSSAITSIV